MKPLLMELGLGITSIEGFLPLDILFCPTLPMLTLPGCPSLSWPPILMMNTSHKLFVRLLICVEIYSILYHTSFFPYTASCFSYFCYFCYSYGFSFSSVYYAFCSVGLVFGLSTTLMKK
jgi:hypothetical protein